MKIQGRIPMEAGEFEFFASDVADKMVGKNTSDGWIVVAAENAGAKLIWLTVEKDIEPPLTFYHTELRGTNGT